MHVRKLTLLPETFPTREHYPFSLAMFQQTREIEFRGPVTFFVGENGTGKSTLLEAIAQRCDIHIWRGMRRERYGRNPYEAVLHKCMTVEWCNGMVPGSFFASQIFHNFSQLLDEWAAATPKILDYFGGASLMAQSHGQSLMSFFRSRFKIEGLYLLDEPETALSAKTQIELLRLLQDMSRAGHAQFIIATHSPILLACPGATIYSFDHVPVREVDYEETDHFRIYRDFLSDPGRYTGKR